MSSNEEIRQTILLADDSSTIQRLVTNTFSGTRFEIVTVSNGDAAIRKFEEIRPAAACWNSQLSEFILTYDDVRHAESPEQTLYDFLESTYKAGARLSKWDRTLLEA